MKKYLLAIMAISLTLFFSCKSGNGDPKAVLSQFFDALSKKDLVAARKLATADSKSMLDLMEMGMKTDTKETEKYDKSKMEFGEVKIEGDKATITVKELTSGESLNYSLKKEAGDWKVAFDKASIMSMGMDKMKEKGINVADSLDHVMDELKKVNIDTLQKGLEGSAKMIDSAAKMLEKLKK